MNKKLIIGLVLGGVLIAGGLYLYNRNKKATELKKNLATESNALEAVDLMGKKDTPYTTEQTKKFVELYKINVDKDLHNKIISALNKKESDFTAQDKLATASLIEKVVSKLNK